MEVGINKTIYHPIQQSQLGNSSPNQKSYYNASGWENLGNIFGPEGAQVKVSVDLKDATLLKAFGIITLGVGLGMTIGFVVNSVIRKNK